MVNDTMLHFGHMELPFGGINNSGQGSSTGYAAFREFSHERGVMVRKWATMSFLYPPYNDLKRALLNAFKRIL
jgi:aldehyde dehydrogenase (NAD+)